MREEEVEADRRDDCLDDDLGGIEPADLLAAIEHQLQRADADRERDEAEPVEASFRVLGSLVHEDHEADHGEDADRQVDEEHPVPAVVIGEPGAQGRPHDRPEHHADAPDSHGRAALLGRIGIEHDGLRERHQRRAERALQQAEADHLHDRLRESAQDRGHGEPGRANNEQALASEAFGDPADRRGHDRGCDDVGGEHPVDLVERGRKASLHIGQCHVGDGGVQRLHDGRAHRADRHHHPAHARRQSTGRTHGRASLFAS